MVIADPNKGSYFYLEIGIDQYLVNKTNNVITQEIENSVDIILSLMTANENVYKFVGIDKIIYLFATNQRKRKGQLVKQVDKYLIEKGLITSYDVISFLKAEFKGYLIELKKKQSLKLVAEPTTFSGYNGRDLQFLDESKKNWYPWQKEIYDELFYSTGEIKPADPRKIIFIYDPKGASGKSVFIKYLYTKHSDGISKVSSGTASQLRSCLIAMGPTKKIYFIDIPRSKEKYSSDSDLLNAIEDLKNGFLSSPMYGRDATLLIEPPHIVIISNYLFEDSGLSKDRWVVKQIKKDKTLSDITAFALSREKVKK
jgi:hypothetical protein